MTYFNFDSIKQSAKKSAEITLLAGGGWALMGPNAR